MTSNRTVTALVVITIVMLVLDGIWLSYIAPTFRSMVASIQGRPMQINWVAAAAVYVLMIAGLWWFVVRSATDWTEAALQGAALGAVVYGVYDFTNLSTIAGWRTNVAIQDWLWGTFLFGVTAAVATYVGSA
jgi:uncharacterized membrane protein